MTTLSGRFFLCSYWPLCKTAGGRRAVARFALPPFANGMSRREPDFEHARPAITASSRGANFAPRLRPGDTVVYITTKGAWRDGSCHPDDAPRAPHWRLAAALEVTDVFASHDAAAAWYRERAMRLPSTLVVDGNPPLPVPLTLRHGRLHDDAWDAVCVRRAAACGAVAVCRPHDVELFAPPVVTPDLMRAVFGTVPNTRTPPEITEAQADQLSALARPSSAWRRAA